MESQPLSAFLRFDENSPQVMVLAPEKIATLKAEHAHNFKRALRARSAIYAEIDSGTALLSLLLHALSYSITKEMGGPTQDVVTELSKPSTAPILHDLLCNVHSTEYFSKGVRVDYENIFLSKSPQESVGSGVSSDHLSFPRLGHHFSPGATRFYPFFCTLFVYEGRLTSAFEVFVVPSLSDLKLQLFSAMSASGLELLVKQIVNAIQILGKAQHPEIAQGKQMAVPIDENSLRQDQYVVITPVPAVQMIYAVDHAIDAQWGLERKGYHHLRVGGSKPHNMGSTVTNLSSIVPGEGSVNLRPLNSYVPPLRVRLYASDKQLLERSYAYSSVLNLKDLSSLAHFKEPLSNQAAFKQWRSLLPAALLPVVEPLVALMSGSIEELEGLVFKYPIEQDFVCKNLPEQKKSGVLRQERLEAISEHVASMIEARLLIYRDLSAGLGVRKKMAISRACARLLKDIL